MKATADRVPLGMDLLGSFSSPATTSLPSALCPDSHITATLSPVTSHHRHSVLSHITSPPLCPHSHITSPPPLSPQSHHITATLHSVPTVTSHHRHCPHSHITSPPLCTLSPQSHHITTTLHSVPTVTQPSLNPATSVPLYTLSTVTLPSLNSSIQN